MYLILSSNIRIIASALFLFLFFPLNSDFQEHSQLGTFFSTSISTAISINLPHLYQSPYLSASVTTPLQRIRGLHWACSLQMQPVDGAKWREGRGGERDEDEKERCRSCTPCRDAVAAPTTRAAQRDFQIATRMERDSGRQMAGMTDYAHQRGENIWSGKKDDVFRILEWSDKSWCMTINFHASIVNHCACLR